ncbi:hypothetical protein LIER_18896 [Lithospermum erythrorhizon]|uniref:Retroviral polymerase SH3-like domain-containing protein n=1 Tax=Lithospermum erythrorhizon TaxID=34254 RepID=A0AAV3QIP6_LITER
MSQNFQDFLRFKVLVHEKSCAYTPQQNGIVERTRALMFQYHLPKSFWGDAVLTSTYLINRLPSHILDWKSPYEMLNKEAPDISHLRVFGCLVFFTNIVPHKEKFAPRAFPAIFLGYPPSQKAYKLFDIVNHKVIISRDVVFYEHLFPYKIGDQGNVSTPNTINAPDHDHIGFEPGLIDLGKDESALLA